MRQDSKKMIRSFLTNYFSTKRVKNKKGNWHKVVVIPGGYIRNSSRTYNWNKNIEVHLVIADLIQILNQVFSCNEIEAQEIALEHLKILGTLTTSTLRTRKTVRTTPTRRPLI
jgi:hypothetical protein